MHEKQSMSIKYQPVIKAKPVYSNFALVIDPLVFFALKIMFFGYDYYSFVENY